MTLSFHNDESIKAKYLAILNRTSADEIILGIRCSNFEGCSMADLEDKFGVPEWLARLRNTISQKIPNRKVKQFVIVWAEAIPVGVDLSKVKHRYCSWLLEENLKLVNNLVGISPSLKAKAIKAIQQCQAVEELRMNNTIPAPRKAASAQKAAISAISAAYAAMRERDKAARRIQAARSEAINKGASLADIDEALWETARYNAATVVFFASKAAVAAVGIVELKDDTTHAADATWYSNAAVAAQEEEEANAHRANKLIALLRTSGKDE